MAQVIERVLLRNVDRPNSSSIETYLMSGGYGVLKKALSMTPAAIIDEVKKSNLRGAGGAGFPTGMKWSFVPKDGQKPIYLVVNGDEGEPGTFKDRLLMERDPHSMLEGIAITSYAIGAHTAYIYIRGELGSAIRIVERAIGEAYAQGFLGRSVCGSGHALDVYVHPGAGAYICGEETALLESLEGRQGKPRNKPPFPAQVGLWGCPTVVNNVETLSCVPHIIERGAAWFAGLGTEKSGGTKLFAVSGHVKRPGVYELPMGTNLLTLIHEHCGGILGDRQLKAVIPGGLSAPPLAAAECDVALEFEALKKVGTMLGSAAIIVVAEGTCMVRFHMRLAKFFAHESCGQCTPCREGTSWAHKTLRKIERGEATPQELDLLLDICRGMSGTTICPLADSVALPSPQYVRKWGEEYRAHIALGRCPFPDPWGGLGLFAGPAGQS
jgi:NADH-quinone oxidoreductase subunit F